LASPGDPVAVFEQCDALGVAAVLGELEPDARLRRERDHHLDRGRRERQRTLVTAGGQHAAHVPGRPQRKQDHRPECYVLAGHGCDPACRC
jgi:hypothetical protein